MTEKNPLIFIAHMLESVKDIGDFTLGVSKEEIEHNKEKLNAVVRSIEIIGEAAKNLPASFKEKNREIAWKEIIGTRDILIHHYLGVDVDILWNIIKFDLPALEKQLRKVKK